MCRIVSMCYFFNEVIGYLMKTVGGLNWFLNGISACKKHFRVMVHHMTINCIINR
jgi:hypothetical protein